MTKRTVFWTCAVCHRVVKESDTMPVQHEGQIYHTCSVRCGERFTMFPNEYANTSDEDEIEMTLFD
ncbi:MAG: hypothetical protein A2Z21_07095 [Candidatus Fraserbacteria bacterium RBG_16_55_9]|uniref:TRASH domain-containing protein n=1 Tax=Fraserbacteria sp. (strain RBG_16_55_9) TaxID=1817864 RepID=A0A1F5USK8_FRAXR|nr:MAG: hypothetical protein A2Z21_07095 [Candidatus Fraserbacteria bacterium RBG_16_55_9]